MNKLTPIIALAALLGTQSKVAAQADDKTSPSDDVVLLEKFVTDAHNDPEGLLPSTPSRSLFGMAKAEVDTPRSITIFTSETLGSFGINQLQDLERYSPGLYTAFNFGIEGSLNIRGDAADLYYDGVMRITNTANAPTIIGASDGVEIVRGPPSPIYGDGQVGGYMNYIPRTARASTGKYLDSVTGKESFTLGSYNEKIEQFEIGGPIKSLKHPGGFYLYTYLEDSDSFYIGSFTRQQIVQATFNVDLTKKLRMEIGGQYQNYRGTGVAGWNRVTQQLISNSIYIKGQPLANLDTNGDGLVSYNEILAAGDLNKTVAIGTPVASLPALPKGFALNPATVGNYIISPRDVLLERYLHTEDYIGFADLIADSNPDLIFSSKSFFEFQNHDKFSDITYFRHQYVNLFEQRFTVTEKPERLPEWLTVKNAMAASTRYLDTFNTTSSSEQVHSRIDLSDYDPEDATIADGGLANGLEYPNIGGVQSASRSRTTQYGVGAISDITFLDRINLMLGGREDGLFGDYRQYVSNYVLLNQFAKGTDRGFSYSASLSVQVIGGLHAYATYGKESTIVPGISGGLTSVTQLTGGALSVSNLKEGGFKGQFLKDKLYITTAVYQQERGTFNSVLDAIQFTRGRGLEFEGRYVPDRHFNTAFSAGWERVDTDPLIPQTGFLVNPQFLGYTGEQAYGGRILTTIPALPQYSRKQGFPDHIFSLMQNYIFDDGFDVAVGVTYQCRTFLSILQDVQLPSATVWTSSIGYKTKRWELRGTVKNLNNERYFNANATNAVLVIPAIGRTFEGKLTYKF